MDDEIFGYCAFGYYSHIQISDIFKNKKTIGLRWTIYHELGHCLLNAPHDHSDGNSIMAPKMPAYMNLYANDRDNSYVEEAAKEYLQNYKLRNKL